MVYNKEYDGYILCNVENVCCAVNINVSFFLRAYIEKLHFKTWAKVEGLNRQHSNYSG